MCADLNRLADEGRLGVDGDNLTVDGIGLTPCRIGSPIGGIPADVCTDALLEALRARAPAREVGPAPSFPAGVSMTLAEGSGWGVEKKWNPAPFRGFKATVTPEDGRPYSVRIFTPFPKGIFPTHVGEGLSIDNAVGLARSLNALFRGMTRYNYSVQETPSGVLSGPLVERYAPGPLRVLPELGRYETKGLRKVREFSTFAGFARAVFEHSSYHHCGRIYQDNLPGGLLGAGCRICDWGADAPPSVLGQGQASGAPIYPDGEDLGEFLEGVMRGELNDYLRKHTREAAEGPAPSWEPTILI